MRQHNVLNVQEYLLYIIIIVILVLRDNIFKESIVSLVLQIVNHVYLYNVNFVKNFISIKRLLMNVRRNVMKVIMLILIQEDVRNVQLIVKLAHLAQSKIA